ncbi:hypothetical protein HPB51_013451 [Rhipicephalus microplus]|uniref:Uncharacterized protein n=1 Tax=Rhipicephalus microplus TaxID=6941 RepID=A0A9J6E9E7_RHIMP|nr:hypothetical protein HPB51_013451 [Rhipicephalus microplus]
MSRIEKGSRMSKLSAGYYKIVIRPRGGLRVVALGPTDIPRGIHEAAATPPEIRHFDAICPNKTQNIMIVSTPDPDRETMGQTTRTSKAKLISTKRTSTRALDIKIQKTTANKIPLRFKEPQPCKLPPQFQLINKFSGGLPGAVATCAAQLGGPRPKMGYPAGQGGCWIAQQARETLSLCRPGRLHRDKVSRYLIVRSSPDHKHAGY